MKMSDYQNWTRRRLLQTTALSAGLASPLLSVSDPVPPSPRDRAIFIYTPMGAPNVLWQPDECGGYISLRSASLPLEPVKHHCLFLNNLYMPDSGHGNTEKALGGGYTEGRETTLDVRLGKAWSNNVLLPNLFLGANVFEPDTVSTENTTKFAFAKKAAEVYKTVLNQNGAVGNTSIDAEFRAVQGSSVPPSFDKEVDMQIGLTALALSRNITNVVTLMWGDTTGAFFLPEYYTSPHVDFHQAAAGFATPELFGKFRAYLSAKITYLIQLLEVMRDDSNHGLLDNTLIVHVTDTGDGGDHSGENAPYFLAGAKNRFRNGAVVNVNRATQYDLMDTIAAAYGLDTNYGSQTIDEIRKT